MQFSKSAYRLRRYVGSFLSETPSPGAYEKTRTPLRRKGTSFSRKLAPEAVGFGLPHD